GTASDVTLSNPLPGGNAAPPVTCSLDTGTGDFASFALGGPAGSQTLTLAGQPISLLPTQSLTVHVTAPTSSTSCGTYDNTATVTATNEAASADADNTAKASETVNCPDI